MHFLHFIFNVLDHLYYHFSELFSRYFAYFLFIFFFFLYCVFLVCSFICAVFPCLYFFSFLFFKVIVLEVSFSQASRKVESFPWRRLNSFFLLVSALLRLIQWFLWASYRVRFVLTFCLFVCLFFPWRAIQSEVVLLSADDWVCIFALFAV